MTRPISRLTTALGAVSAVFGAAYALTFRRERLTPRQLANDNQFLMINGYELHYTDEGPRNGPVVAMIHGFAASTFTWRAQRSALAAAGFRVIALDLLGFGASARPSSQIYTTETQAELLLGALDLLGVRTAALVGHSYGGRVAMQMALYAPERISALVLIAPEAFSYGRPWIANLVRLPVLGFALTYYTTLPGLVRTGLNMVTTNHAWLSEHAVAGYAAPIRVRGNVSAQVWQSRSRKDGRLPVPTHHTRITAPTLLVWGESDPVFPLEHARMLRAALPHSHLLTIPECGHLPHEEYEPLVTQRMQVFLRANHASASHGTDTGTMSDVL